MRKYDQSFLLVRHGNIVSLIFYSYDLSDILTGRNFCMAERFRVEHRSITKVLQGDFFPLQDDFQISLHSKLLGVFLQINLR